MAIYYLGMKTFGRARGKSGSRATSGAAYRAGERIRDERTGAVYDHRDRRDVLHKEIVLPAHLAARGRELDWARERSRLWNAAELVEARRNARVAREFTVALPHELAPERRTRLARRFAQEIADRYRNAVDVAVHAPRGDPRNFHAHLFATTREVASDGLGPKTTLELSGTERHRRGLLRWGDEMASLRERWAVLTNEALKEAHVEARVVYLSPAALAARPVAAPRLPTVAFRMEQRGYRSFVAERIRERYRSGLAREQPGGSQSVAGRDAPRTAGGSGATTFERFRAGVQARWAALVGTVRERPSREIRDKVPGRRDSAGERVRAESARSASIGAPRAGSASATGRTAGRERPPYSPRVVGPRTASLEDVAGESARRWRAYREAVGPRTASLEDVARESARQWRAYRDGGGPLDSGRSNSALARDAPEAERAKSRGLDNDLSL